MTAPSSLPIGTVALVTGATGGIGKVTARVLAAQGATVVIVSHSDERCRDAVQQIIAQTGNQNVSAIVADLSTQAGVRQASAEFLSRHTRLDILVNNAGALFTNRSVSADGIDMTFALNHFGPFLLTSLLLDTIRASAPARIVTVSSSAHRAARGISFDKLRSPIGGFGAYSQSKLANVLFTYELAQRLAGTGVTANALHPGVVNTGFGKNNGALFRVVFNLVWPLFTVSPEEGARTSVYLASSPDVATISGAYFEKQRPVRSSPLSYDTALARRLWEVSEQLTAVSPIGERV